MGFQTTQNAAQTKIDKPRLSSGAKANDVPIKFHQAFSRSRRLLVLMLS